MRLNPKEQEKLMLHMAGNLAKERKERGLKLNYVEALAYISSELLELARDGKTVVELMQLGTKILTKDDVMDGKRSEKIDKILTGKYTAIPCFIGIMVLVFYLTFNVIGAWPGSFTLR